MTADVTGILSETSLLRSVPAEDLTALAANAHSEPRSGPGSQVEDLPLGGHHDGDRPRGEPLGQPVERIVRPVRPVMEQHHLPGPRALGQCDPSAGG